VPVDKVPAALLRIVTRYQRDRRRGEPFHRWSRRTADEELVATLLGTPEPVAP
jgi:sulfite reductase beta subunit-like hemoprotein